MGGWEVGHGVSLGAKTWEVGGEGKGWPERLEGRYWFTGDGVLGLVIMSECPDFLLFAGRLTCVLFGHRCLRRR